MMLPNVVAWDLLLLNGAQNCCHRLTKKNIFIANLIWNYHQFACDWRNGICLLFIHCYYLFCIHFIFSDKRNYVSVSICKNVLSRTTLCSRMTITVALSRRFWSPVIRKVFCLELLLFIDNILSIKFVFWLPLIRIMHFNTTIFNRKYVSFLQNNMH